MGFYGIVLQKMENSIQRRITNGNCTPPEGG